MLNRKIFHPVLFFEPTKIAQFLETQKLSWPTRQSSFHFPMRNDNQIRNHVNKSKRLLRLKEILNQSKL